MTSSVLAEVPCGSRAGPPHSTPGYQQPSNVDLRPQWSAYFKDPHPVGLTVQATPETTSDKAVP